MLALFSSIVLCALLLWLLFGAIAALGYRLVRPKLQAIDPGQASLLLLGWLALPPFASLLTCYVLYSPDLAQSLVGGHCHFNNCRVHGPQSALAIIPAGLLTLWTLYSVTRCFLQLWLPAQHLTKQLRLVGNNTGEFVRLDSVAPVAFTLGWFNPKIFISAGMLSACSIQEIDCIVRHERAHRRRYDNVRLLLASLFSAPLPRRWALPAVVDLKLCCEKACDLSAATELSREAVAAALIRVARIQQSPSPSVSLAFVGNQTEQRILALLDQPQATMANELVFATLSVTLLIILAMINPLHQAVELLP